MRARVLIVPVLLLAVAAPPADAREPRRALQQFDSCGQLLDYVREHGKRVVRTGWAPGWTGLEGPREGRLPMVPEGQPAPQATTAPGADSTSFSTTNVQEEGVDEPDVVKTDGTTLYAVANGVLHSIDVTGDAPVLLAALELKEGHGHELLLHEDRLLVLQNAWLEDMGAYGRPVMRLTEVDVSDPAAPRVLRRERNDGEYVSARLTGTTVRVVLASRPPVLHAIAETSARNRRALIGKRLRRVRRARLAAWRPRTVFRDAQRPELNHSGALTRCAELRHTARFSGLDMVTILTVDLEQGLPSVDADAILSDAQIVYGSPDRLYVATQRWLSPRAARRAEPPPTRTEIHQFDASEPGRTAYVASGSVDGYLLNQFAMSEHAGVLRVASTETPLWWGSPDTGESSTVTTLERVTMGQLGRVGGLGKGERIYAVRFIGDRGYVVTFRQIDPLYTLDLADPASPRVTGELKIAGYSAYLHPVSERMLLGVGQDAGRSGRTTGTQLSLFDVSDPARPTRVAQRAIADASSSAEYDHHAFLYWPQEKLAVIPIQVYRWDDQADSGSEFVGAIGFRLDPAGIEEVGRLEHPPDEHAMWEILRSTVVGGRLFTLSAAGVMSSPLATLGAGPFLTFPSKPTGWCGSGSRSTVASCPTPAR